MGYFLNTFIKGAQYELSGQRLEFFNKSNGLYYFYRYSYNEDDFSYNKINELVAFTLKELNYIKRFNDMQNKIKLQKIGNDKVFQRY